MVLKKNKKLFTIAQLSEALEYTNCLSAEG